MSRVDFLVIGAQKCATTSLFRYLAAHPSIYMPPEKELDFFSSEASFAEGLDAYLQRHFSRADPALVRGEASPSYMAHDRAPARIAAALPAVRLVAILRDPLERAFSHYRMAVGRGLEPRSFLNAVRDHLDARSEVDPERDYVRRGEYGRILSGYLRALPREQLHVAFAERLGADTGAEMERAYRFLGVDPSFRSPVFERRFHTTGEKRYRALRRFLAHEPVRAVVRAVLPAAQVRRWNHWYLTEFGTRAAPRPAIDARARELLREHYRADTALLERELGLALPWSE